VNAATLRPTPWTTADLDPEATLAQLSQHFPGIRIWFGDFTGHYWALVRDRLGHDRLIEATSPTDLSLRLGALLARPPVPTRSQRRVPNEARHTKRPATGTSRPTGKRPTLLNRALRSLVHRDAEPHGRTGAHG
jgi:hypothetical protein